MQARWIDTHAHLDAAELGLWPLQKGNFEQNRSLVPDFAGFNAIENIAFGLIPAVEVSNFLAVQALAQHLNWGYALGIHPMYTPQAADADLEATAQALQTHAADPRLLAVGEIGIDCFVNALREPAALAKQERFYRQQLKLARQHSLPVVLHVRRSADLLLKHLRQIEVPGGIAHAFNGSLVQARQFIERGFKLGFGGAVTFPQASHLHELARSLPLDAIVLETDSPDIAPQWLYVTAAQRAAGQAQGINTPAQLPRIAQVLADLRGMPLADLQAATFNNALQALPRMAGLLTPP
jgi:TatD DNase family protein